MASCGGFTCSKNALAALNVLYMLVALILIGVAAYSKAASYVTSFAIMGGIITCGVLLLLLAIMGFIAATKHHQVMLFFYMIVLALLFLVQFAVACTCLAVNATQQHKLAASAWNKGSDKTREDVMKHFRCCGFEDQDLIGHGDGEHLACNTIPLLSHCQASDAVCCTGIPGNTTTPANTTACPYHNCWGVIEQYMDQGVKVSGGISLFFSFTEIIGVWLAVRYRNQKDPRANPSAFL